MAQTIKSNCLKFMLVLSLLQLCLLAKSQYNFSGVDKLLLANQKTLGKDVVTIVLKDGQIVYQKAMGNFMMKSQAPIASCSKWLTAALVMTFVDEGKISLDDKVSTYLPIYETYGKAYITIRNCLSHQTGITDNQHTIAKVIERRKFESLEDEVNSFAKKEIAANPGTTFFYGDIGLNIAARVLEVVSKKKFEVLMKQRIFTPLNMKHSTFAGDADAVNPSGGAVSTPEDYINFLSMILNKGMFAGKRILSEVAINTMQTVQTANIPKKYFPKTAEGFEYGLGEWIQETDGKGNSTVISCPGLFGTWPWIDKCRGYAGIIFVKSLLSEQNKDVYLEIKKSIDELIPTVCN
jgi:CubicO group peptidase (beta-lactamase class C family)